MKIAIKLLFATVSIVLITACGGGSSGGSATVVTGPVASANAFNLKSGYSRLVSAGYTKTFNITGTCIGTFTITAGPATTSTTFEGASALSGAEVASFSFVNCTPSTDSSTITRYYDSNYIPKGSATVGGDYTVYTSTPSISSTARVGDVTIIGTRNRYTSSTKTTSTGRTDETLVLEADTATTAIANVISKNYNASGTLTMTEQDRYRVSADGSLTPIALDAQYANGSTTHLIGN